MNLIYADLREVFSKEGMRMGKICIGGALKNVTLDLIPEAECGDRLLVCEGVAIARVESMNISERRYVSSDTW
jgi:hydrogenase maturation factor